jgi:hypothetical protein
VASDEAAVAVALTAALVVTMAACHGPAASPSVETRQSSSVVPSHVRPSPVEPGFESPVPSS